MTLKEYYNDKKQIRKNINSYVRNNQNIDITLNEFHKEYEAKLNKKQQRKEKFYHFWFRLIEKISFKKKHID